MADYIGPRLARLVLRGCAGVTDFGLAVAIRAAGPALREVAVRCRSSLRFRSSPALYSTS